LRQIEETLLVLLSEKLLRPQTIEYRLRLSKVQEAVVAGHATS